MGHTRSRKNDIYIYIYKPSPPPKVKKLQHTYMGASMVKWTAIDPCSCLSASDPKLCTNVEFREIDIHKNLQNIGIYKAKQSMFTNKQFLTTYIYFTRRCKW